MSTVVYKQILPEEAGVRLDNYLIRLLKGVPKSHIYRIIRAGEVRVNKKRAKPFLHLQAQDEVRVPPVRVAEQPSIFVSDKMTSMLQQCILFEDKELLVLNKPHGWAVHGGSDLNLGLIEALRKIRSDLTYLELVHRLDKGTSGCLLLAKKRSTLRAIQTLLRARQVEKHYWALLMYPWTGNKQKIVDISLKKQLLHSNERKVVVSEEGKPSQTQFKLLENFSEYCLIEACPLTGRTHQIRVHSQALGQPIVGDEKYKGMPFNQETTKTPRLYLHAKAIHFTLNEKKYSFEAAPDKQFMATLKKLRERSE